MRTVNFGQLEVSAIGLGCMSMSDTYGPSDRDEASATLLRAVELGVTLFDTANAYGAGHNEELLGEVLAPHRDQILLSTKFGFALRDGKIGIDGRPEQVADRCNESLARLNTDHVDLYFLHRVDTTVAIEETVGAMAQLVAAGKVRHLGLSEVSADTLRRAHAVHPISAVQSEYSLWSRDPEAEMLDVCAELGVGFMPFSPLGRAMLTGQINSPDDVTGDSDRRGTMPRFSGDSFTSNRELVAELESIAQEIGASSAQVSLAWLMAQRDFIAPIPGTRRRKWLEQNVAAADVELDDATVQRLGALFSPDRVSGPRYPASQQPPTDTPAR